MKEYIRLIEKLHPDSDVLSVNEKYKILSRVLAETKSFRIGIGIFAFAAGAVLAGLAFAFFEFLPQEPLGHIIKGSIASGLAFLCYLASKKIILRKYIRKMYSNF